MTLEERLKAAKEAHKWPRDVQKAYQNKWLSTQSTVSKPTPKPTPVQPDWSIQWKLNDYAKANPYASTNEIVNHIKDTVWYKNTDDQVYNKFYWYYKPKTKPTIKPTVEPTTPKVPINTPVSNTQTENTLVTPTNVDDAFNMLVKWDKINMNSSISQEARKRLLTAKAKDLSSWEELANEYKNWLINDANIKDIALFNPKAVAKFKQLKDNQYKLDNINNKTKDIFSAWEFLKNIALKFDEIAKWEKNLLAKKAELLNTPEIKAQKKELNKSTEDLNNIRLKQQNLEDNIRTEYSWKATENFIQAKIRKESKDLRQQEQQAYNTIQFQQSQLWVLTDAAKDDYNAIVAQNNADKSTLTQSIWLYKTFYDVQSKEQQKYQSLLASWALDWLTDDQLNEMDKKAWLPIWTWTHLKNLAILDRKQWTDLATAKLNEITNKVKSETPQVMDVRQWWIVTSDYIKWKEWFRTDAYLDASWTPTIWYWFTSINWVPVKMWDTITKDEADKEFNKQIQNYKTFEQYVTVPLSEDQKTALTSFEYNLWSNIWNKDWRKIIQLVNKWEFTKAWELMKQFNKIKDSKTGKYIELPWLSNRRSEEASMLQVKPLNEYNNNLKPLYIKYNNGKMTSADWNTLKSMWENTKDFTEGATSFKRSADSAWATFAKEVINLAKELKTDSWKTWAGFWLWFIPYTDWKDYSTTFNAFKSKLSLQNLLDLKNWWATFWALSDQELNFISNATTQLDMWMTTDKYNKEIDRIVNKLSKAIPWGYQDNTENNTQQTWTWVWATIDTLRKKYNY